MEITDRADKQAAPPHHTDNQAPPRPTDPDVDLHVPAQRRELSRHPVAILSAIAAGGAIGALARFGISAAVPHPPGGMDWATFWINVTGSFLLGALMVVITELTTPHHLVRPFLGVGVLGGYTTFSTAMVDVQRMIAAGAAGTGLAYLAGTALAALAAAYLGAAVTRRVARVAR